ncbi:Ig-like domain-containing protein [Butyrivibrio sp. JL13D10]|uniref:Ig-like domain-containing protein n=1 Tax=Butyrivibrio sp. JL13D10 TaxID=3236815 RepID=UPI0038B64918
MRKEIWGKLAIALSAALFTESAAPLQAMATSETEYSSVVSDNSEEGESESKDSTEEQSEKENETVENSNENSAEESSESATGSSEQEQTENNTVNAEDDASDNIQKEDSSENDTDNSSSTENSASENLSEGMTDDEDSEAEQTNDTEGNDESGDNAEDSETALPEEDVADAVSDGNAVTDGDAISEESDVFDYETTVDGYRIKLHAEAGVVPAGTEVSVKKVNKVDGKKTDDLVNEVLPEESAVYKSASFDITLLKDGEEFEPEGKVSVEITLDDKLADISSENEDVSLQVFHIEDDQTTTEVEANVNEDATDVYDKNDETVVSYDAESFSVYDVSAVVNFTTSEPEALENPVYEQFLSVSKEQLDEEASGLDSTVNVKTLFSQGGKCTSVQEMAEIARNAIKARQNYVTINFKMPGIYNQYNLYSEIMPIMNEHTGVPNEGDYARWSYVIHAYQTTTSFVNNATYGTFQFKFTYTDTAAQEAQAGAEIAKLIQSQKWASLKTDKAKVDAVYNWICNNVYYEPYYKEMDDAGNYYAHSCHSAIVPQSRNGKKIRYTVCQGYSMLFYRIMLSLGVDNRMVSGLAYDSEKNSGHAWNMVLIGNKYYYVDSTWDHEFLTNGYGKPYYLRGSKTFKRASADYPKTNFDSTEHIRYAECATADFYNVYPISTTDYSSVPNYVKATSVSLSQYSAYLGLGATMQLRASCAPANTSQRVKWNSSDPAVASVNANGVVTGLKLGECEIFATSEYGGKKARCRVVVTDGRVQDIEVATPKITVYAGSKAQISASVFPYWANNKGIKFKSSKKSIATVNKNGIIRGNKPGKCTITCKAIDGGASVKIKVTVKKAKRVKAVKLTKKKLKLHVGDRFTLGVSFKPRKATNKEVAWKSSKPSVVYVDAGGNLVALQKGKAKITVVSDDGKHKATCTVKVK